MKGPCGIREGWCELTTSKNVLANLAEEVDVLPQLDTRMLPLGSEDEHLQPEFLADHPDGLDEIRVGGYHDRTRVLLLEPIKQKVRGQVTSDPFSSVLLTLT